MQNNTGLNGFRSWWRRNRESMKDVLDLAGPLGRAVIGIVDMATGFNDRLEYEYDLPLTASEEAILDDYVHNQFIPYYNDTVLLVGGVALETGKVAQLTLVEKINIGLKRIALLRAYLNYQDLFPPSNYSANMLTSRKKFVNEYLVGLYTAIKQFGTDNGIDITNADKTTFQASLIRDEAGMQFSWARAITAHYYKVDNTKIIVDDVVIGTDPIVIGDTVIENDPSGEVIVVGEEIEPTTGLPTTKGNSNAVLKWIVGLGITIGIIAVATNSKDEKSK